MSTARRRTRVAGQVAAGTHTPFMQRVSASCGGREGAGISFLQIILSVVSGGNKPETTTPVGRQELQTVGWVEAALHPFAFEACGLGRPKPNCPRARTYHTRHESRWVTAEKPAVQNQTVEAA